MPPNASPFSMLGMFMGKSSSSRKRKDKDVKAQSQSQLGRDEEFQEVKKASQQEVFLGAEKDVGVLVEHSGSDSETSSTDDHMYSVINQSISTGQAGYENEWTEVPTQRETGNSSTDDLESKGSTIYESDDTSSMESLEKQELQEEVRRQADRLEKKDDELRGVRKETGEVENRLKAVTTELQAAGQLNDNLRGENKQQLDEINRLRENLRATEEDRDDKLARLASSSKEQLDSVLRRNRALGDDNQRQLNEIRRLEKRLQGLEGSQLDTSKRLEGAELRGRELGEQVKIHLAECQAYDKQLRSLQVNNVKTTNQLNAALSELNTVALRNEELTKQSQLQAEEVQKRENELASVKAEMAEMPKNNSNDTRRDEVLERQNRMLQDQIRRQSHELQSTMSQSLPRPIQSLQRLERSSKEDDSGGVIGLLNSLNSEIFQTAAFMADSLSYTSSTSLPVQKLKEAIERATQTIGRPIVLILRSKLAEGSVASVEFDTLPIQIALQACLVNSCMKIISSWYPGHWEYSDFLSVVYSRIQGTAGQHVSTRWRELTQAQLKNPSDGYVETSLKAFVTESLVYALNTAGWSETGPQAENTLAAFDEKLSMIVKLALRLNATLGGDWEATVVQPDEIFDPETMLDAYDEYQETDVTEWVVCTTDIGLNTLSGGGTTVKPKVVIHSMLEEERG